MPKLSNDVPEAIRPYKFHGCELEIRGSEAVGDCPLCGKEDKFSVNVESSLAQCFTCGVKTNGKGFIRILHERSFESTEDYEHLVNNRGIEEETFDEWGVCKSVTTNDWIVPAYNPEGNTHTLYRWIRYNGSANLLLTPTFGHGIFGVSTLTQGQEVFITEGPWDAMRLWQEFRESDSHDHRDVLGVPGCGTWVDSWYRYIAGKDVRICFDNDHPKKQCKGCRKTYPHNEEICPHCGSRDVLTELPPRGYEASLTLARKLSAHGSPQSISILQWGEQGYTESLPNGYDVRDLLNA